MIKTLTDSLGRRIVILGRDLMIERGWNDFSITTYPSRKALDAEVRRLTYKHNSKKGRKPLHKPLGGKVHRLIVG